VGEDSGQHVIRRRRFSLFPRFEEAIAPEFYRWTGKVRVFAISLLVASNYLGGLQLHEMGYDPGFYWSLQVPVTTLGLIGVLVGLLVWRGRRSIDTMRRLTQVGAAVDVVAVLIGIWAFGSVGSYMTLFGALVVLVYRVAFDFRTGALAFLVMLLGMWAIGIGEINGWLPYEPVSLHSAMSMTPTRQLSALLLTSFMLVVMFLVGNWTVARLRHKELAVRILRQTLAASGEGRVGRHTGATLCDTYAVEGLIGTGGMGEVYRGQHRRTQRPVAIKVLHSHLVDDETLMRRFRREAEITGRLGSRHIVDVIDVDRDGDIPFLVLELLEGTDLRERLASGPLGLAETADLLDQVAAGLEVAHDAGIVHRDLKPENLFLCADGERTLVKILDFGVSKIRGNATAITHEIALIGTPDFMSPEQAVALTDEVDARTDIFALGAIAYYCLTGRRPFQAGSIPALLRRICDEEPVPIAELRKEVPAAVLDVITIAMAKDRDARYAGVAELREDFRTAFCGKLAPAVSLRACAVPRGQPASRSVATTQLGETLAAGVAAGTDRDRASASAPTIDAQRS
jgi:hypothetical protein